MEKASLPGRKSVVKFLDRKYTSKKSFGRRILENLVAKYKIQKEKEIQETRNKIDFSHNKEQHDKIIKSAPEGTEEILSEVMFLSQTKPVCVSKTQTNHLFVILL